MIRRGLGFGIGNGVPPIAAACAPGGTGASQLRTRNCAALTLPKARPGSARTAIGMLTPSNTTAGHASSVTTRALAAPSGPSCTHCAKILAWAPPRGTTASKANDAAAIHARDGFTDILQTLWHQYPGDDATAGI